MRALRGVAVVLAAAALAGCGQAPATPGPATTQNGYQIRENDMTTLTTTLPSGKKVECLVITYSKGSSMQCWEVLE